MFFSLLEKKKPEEHCNVSRCLFTRDIKEGKKNVHFFELSLIKLPAHLHASKNVRVGTHMHKQACVQLQKLTW